MLCNNMILFLFCFYILLFEVKGILSDVLLNFYGIVLLFKISK